MLKQQNELQTQNPNTIIKELGVKRLKYKKNKNTNYKVKKQRKFTRTKWENDPQTIKFLKLLRDKKIFYEDFKKQISIKITHNNIFCTLSKLAELKPNIAKGIKSIKEQRTLLVGSAGKYKLHISKKTLRFNTKILIQNFLTLVKNYVKTKENLFIFLSGPIKTRKHILKQIKKAFRLNRLIIKINPLKCFNGCKVKKQRRKKRKKFVIFKKS